MSERWQRYVDACGLRYVHRPMERFAFQIIALFPSDGLYAHDTCLSSRLDQLRQRALVDLWNDTVARADIQYAMRTGDDAYLQALMADRPSWRAEAEGPGGYLAHKRHREAADQLRKRLTRDALARAAALGCRFGDNKSAVLQRSRWDEALAQQCAADLEATLAQVNTSAVPRPRL